MTNRHYISKHFNHLIMNYKPFLLAMLLAPTVAIASVSYLPPAGAIDLENYPSGLSGFEITSSTPLSINRDATGFITLTRNGVAVKEIPASNVRDIYTFSGFDKTEVGDIHVTFFEKQLTSPYRYFGDYTVTVPAGFFTFTDSGTTNEEIVLNYTIDAPEIIPTPASGSTVKSLSEIILEFKDVTSINSGSASKEFVYTFTPNDGSAETEVALTSKSYTINDSEVIFKLENPFETKGTFKMMIPDGTFKAVSSTGIEGKNSAMSISITVNPDVLTSADFTISPVMGEYEGFTSENFASIGKYAFFKVTMPEGMTIQGYPIRTKPLLVSVVDGTPDIENPRFSFSAQANKDENTLYIYNGNLNKSTGDFGYLSEETITPAPGECMLYIPAKLISFTDGTTNDALYFKYKALPSQGEYNYSVIPEPETRVELPISEIQVYFPEAPSAQWVSKQYASLSNGVAEYLLTGEVADADNGGCMISFSIPNGITEPGVYTLYIPLNALLIGGDPTGVRADLYLGVDGPTSVGTMTLPLVEKDDATYTIDGIKLPEGNNVERGVFVRNGQKIIVK